MMDVVSGRQELVDIGGHWPFRSVMSGGQSSKFGREDEEVTSWPRYPSSTRPSARPRRGALVRSAHSECTVRKKKEGRKEDAERMEKKESNSTAVATSQVHALVVH